MNRKILFSPIGGTDPISNNNAFDGAFLHICRVYKPTDVIMYMSAEILENHKKDNRYLYCLDKLCELLGCEINPRIIERGDLREVQKFDWFYEDFQNIFREIYKNMDDTDELLVNISSGTPAMKSALQVLSTLSEYSCKLIQVSTPTKKMNNHTHDDYNVKDLWELDEDNKENFINRCDEIDCPNLLNLKNKELIKKQIINYDYHAALEAAEAIPPKFSGSYIKLLKLAQARKQLDFRETDQLEKECGINFIPIRETEKRSCFEYALVLDTKWKSGEYTDFLRALTPLIADIFEMVLKQQFSVDINKYCRSGKNKVRKWDEGKLENTEILNILNKNFDFPFRYGAISSQHLIEIIDEKAQEGSKLKITLDNLRSIEKNIRNLAAHEIVCIKDENIKEKTGFMSEEIMEMIKDAFKYTGINARKEDWESYDHMNKYIINIIDSKA